MNYVQRSENLMRMFLAGMSYRDHSKTVAEDGFSALWPTVPQYGRISKTAKK